MVQSFLFDSVLKFTAQIRIFSLFDSMYDFHMPVSAHWLMTGSWAMARPKNSSTSLGSLVCLAQSQDPIPSKLGRLAIHNLDLANARIVLLWDL